MKTTRRLIFLALAGLAGASRAAGVGLASPRAAGEPTVEPLSLSELLAAGRSALATLEKDD
jgi:hypothetical protein